MRMIEAPFGGTASRRSPARLGRRPFLAWVGLGLLGPLAPRVAARRLDRIGLHLSSVQQALVADPAATLHTIASIGYHEVEFSTLDGASVDLLDIRRSLDRLSLVAPSRQVRMSDLFSNWRVILSQCRMLGNRDVVCEEVPAEQRASLDGYKRVADLLNAAGKITQWAGIQLALRHHADDFEPREGVVPYDFLLSHTDATLVKMQMDLAVMARVHRDPLDDFARYPGRFASLHVSDVDQAPAQGAAGLGEGRIDLARVIAGASRAGLQHYFVDDERSDSPWEHAKADFAYLSRLEFE